MDQGQSGRLDGFIKSGGVDFFRAIQSSWMPKAMVLTVSPIVAKAEMEPSSFRNKNRRPNMFGSFLAHSDNSLTLAAMMKSFSWRPLIL
jgi:hypothetical protein